MNIMMVANDTTSAYNLRGEVLNRLVQDGHNVSLMCQSLAFRDELDKIGVRIIEVKNNRRGTNPLADVKLFFTYLSHLRKDRPDLVMGYNIKPNVYAGLACRILKIRRICNITGLGTALEQPGLLQKITILLYKLGTWNADCVLFQNTENQQFFSDRNMLSPKTRAVLIPGSGVNLASHPVYAYPSDESIRFLFVARILKEKGIDLYLSAAKAIRKQHPNTQFHICGSIDDDAYAAILDEASAAGDIVYHGEQKNIGKYFEMAHCVVHPSYYPEGISNVLLEAAASGRPVVATNRSGCRETVDDGISGFVIPIKDGQALIDALERFVQLPWAARQAMGLAGRQKVEKEFDRKLVVELTMQEVQKCENAQPVI